MSAIRPLTGQVLISLLPPLAQSAGGIHLLDHPETAPGDKRPPRKGVVIAVGPWRTTRTGLAVLPDMRPGDTVLVSEYLGTKLTRTLGENLRLCHVDEVLAIVDAPHEDAVRRDFYAYLADAPLPYQSGRCETCFVLSHKLLWHPPRPKLLCFNCAFEMLWETGQMGPWGQH